MKKFEWKKEYSIGNDQVDKEHMKLISLANLVLNFSNAGEEATIIKKAVFTLYDYTKTHFANEENYMEEVRYEHLEEHKALHVNIIKEMNTIMKGTTRLDELVNKLKELMSVWVIDHIVTEDKKIGKVLKA